MNNNNNVYQVAMLPNNCYKVGNLVINPTKTQYAENSLKHIEKRISIQQNYIASIEAKLAEARNVKALLFHIKDEVQNAVVSLSQIDEIEIVLVTSVKTGKIKETHLVTAEEAEQLISISNKWMLKSTWEEIYNKVEA